MADEIEVTVAFNGPDEYQAYNDAPACLRELIYRQARELAEAASALRSSGEANAWRPIAELNHRDSRVVLFCDARGNRWTQTADCRVPFCGHPPTHWVPLPAAPTQEKGNG